MTCNSCVADPASLTHSIIETRPGKLEKNFPKQSVWFKTGIVSFPLAGIFLQNLGKYNQSNSLTSFIAKIQNQVN